MIVRRVSCQLVVDVAAGSVLALQVAAAVGDGVTVNDEHLVLTIDGVEVDESAIVASSTNSGRVHVVRVDGASLHVDYEAEVAAPAQPRWTASRGELLYDDETITALRQTRYCPSDALAGFAAVEFPHALQGRELAYVIASWVFERLAYEAGTSRHLDTAIDTLVTNSGVCRDFAHVAIALCRARGVPARMVSAYAPGLSPMDFHAVVEIRVGDRWEVLDPTRLAPRSSLVRIATGRDAADTAFLTTLQGEARLVSTEVSAIVAGALPADDHRAPVTMA